MHMYMHIYIYIYIYIYIILNFLDIFKLFTVKEPLILLDLVV